MKKLLLLLCILFSIKVYATTYTITAGSSTATIQSTITGASAGDTVQFNAATYSITSPITLKCGVTYKATTLVTPSNVTLSSTMGISNAIFQLFPGAGFANPCTQTTTVEYFKFANSGGISVETSFTNLTIVHNQFTNLPCCGTFPQPGTVGISFRGSQQGSNTAQSLGNTDIEWNAIGDSVSCTSPTNGMTSFASPETIQGNCGSLRFDTTINGPVKVWNNTFFHVGESIALGCPGGGLPGTGSAPCEPTRNGVTTNNLSVRYNDFSNIHRIPFEEQPEATSGVDFQYNSEHDGFDPYFGSFGLSFACCTNGATTPYLNTSNNVIVMNSTPHVRWGYGIEAGGKGATYFNNLVEVNGASSIGLSYSYGLPPWAISNNYICGPGFATSGYVADEGQHSTPPTQVGNKTSAICSAVASAPPTISPASSAQNFPMTVTLTDVGYTSGPQPLGNTSIYYTIDGTTPVPGQGSTQLYTAPFTLTAAPGTVKAIGMWGTGANTLTYPSGYGFTISNVVTAGYTSLSGATLVSIAITGTSSVNTGSTDQLTATGTYSDSSTANLTSVAAWLSSSTGIATVNSTGLATGVSAGSTTITATVNAITSPGFGLTVNGGVSSIFFVSSSPAVGTVGPSSGLFTAVGNGTTNVTASIGPIISNVLIMTVGQQPTVLKNVTISGIVQVK